MVVAVLVWLRPWCLAVYMAVSAWWIRVVRVVAWVGVWAMPVEAVTVIGVGVVGVVMCRARMVWVRRVANCSAAGRVIDVR